MNTRLKTFALVVLAFSAMIAVIGCGHTNNLEKYSVRDGKYLFRSTVDGGAPTVSAVIPAPDTSFLAGAISAVGQAVTTGVLEGKVNRVPAGELAGAVSDGIADALKDYLTATEVTSLDDHPQFIVETVLKKYALRSSPSDASAEVCASSRIVDRATGAVVWENSESVTVPLGGASALSHRHHGPVVTTTGAFNAIFLMGLSDEQLRGILAGAAEEAGRNMGETLRKDVAEMRH